MPDCSYVTLTIPNDHVNDQLRQLLDATAHWHQEGPAPNETATVWEAEQESWGADNGGLTALYDWLVAAHVPFLATDAGHYTWDPFEIGYDGRMTKWIYRSSGIDGGPTLSGGELTAIANLEPEAFKTAVMEHFGDDPVGWANNHVA